MGPFGRTIQRAGVATAATLTVGCHPVEHRGRIHFVGPDSGFMQVNARLACPERAGDLTRMSEAADGSLCSYSGPNDENVSLQLMPLAGAQPQAALTKLEARLTSETGLGVAALPTPAAPVIAATAKDWDAGSGSHDGDDDDDDERRSDSPRRAPSTPGDKASHTHIDLPGIHIVANGDKADVSLPGLSIHANGDKAQVNAGWFGRQATVEGREGGATIRYGRADQNGVDSVVIIASDRPGPGGYRTVGYVAKGPPAGPLVVAVFKAKSGRHSEHHLAGDGVKKLVRLNVHQGLGWLSNRADDQGDRS